MTIFHPPFQDFILLTLNQVILSQKHWFNITFVHNKDYLSNQ